MLIIYILLGIVAVGVLLLSEPGKQIVESAYNLLLVGLILFGTIVSSIWVWDFVYQRKEQIGSGMESVAPTIIIIGLLLWLGKKINTINHTEDAKLNKVGMFVKHTSGTMVAVYIIGLFIGAAILAFFFG